MKKIVLAFSGGLDTSFCVPYLKETYGSEVHTAFVDTVGMDSEAQKAIQERALSLGASSHINLDATQDMYDQHIAYMIKGNVLRGGVYPLCVGVERVVQARKVLEHARELGADAVAHGSTGAGNDQVRFDGTMRILADHIKVLTPIRELGLTREASTTFLRERGFTVSDARKDYSINQGLWGTTIGGRETHDSRLPLPDHAYPETVSPLDAPNEPEEISLTFQNGLPVALNGETLDAIALIRHLNQVGAKHGVGRDMHVGDTILGIKGRVGFEAPAALMLIKAHQELEKLILTKWQRFQKDHLADFYGMLLHEGQYYDPVMRDIEAFLDSSQKNVTGKVFVRLFKGHFSILGAESAYSMFNTNVATYGETNTLWDARDAEGFTKIYTVQSMLAHRAKAIGDHS
ncbi:MAG: argininosuccinate synthase [Rhodothermia bacterium]|nr:argininosuccinate synthase [Rhodothermia bacterium]